MSRNRRERTGHSPANGDDEQFVRAMEKVGQKVDAFIEARPRLTERQIAAFQRRFARDVARAATAADQRLKERIFRTYGLIPAARPGRPRVVDPLPKPAPLRRGRERKHTAARMERLLQKIDQLKAQMWKRHEREVSDAEALRRILVVRFLRELDASGVPVDEAKARAEALATGPAYRTLRVRVSQARSAAKRSL